MFCLNENSIIFKNFANNFNTESRKMTRTEVLKISYITYVAHVEYNFDWSNCFDCHFSRFTMQKNIGINWYPTCLFLRKYIFPKFPPSPPQKRSLYMKYSWILMLSLILLRNVLFWISQSLSTALYNIITSTSLKKWIK